MNEALLILSFVLIYGSVMLFYRIFGKTGLIAMNVLVTILANIEVLLLVNAFGIEMTLGNVLFASTFLITDVLSENHSKKDANRAVVIGSVCSVLFVVISQLWLLYTPSANDWARGAFETIFAVIHYAANGGSGLRSDFCQVKVIFSRQTEDTTKQRSLEYAMDYFGLEQHLPAHDALNDAYFTALVARELDVPAGVKSYSEPRGDFLEDYVIGDADAGDDGYVTISEMLEDSIVKRPICPICKRELTEEDKLLHSKGQKYTMHFVCKKHGDMLLSLKLHRNFNDTWRARQTIRLADEAALTEYREGIERANVKRKSMHRRTRRRGGHRKTDAQ